VADGDTGRYYGQRGGKAASTGSSLAYSVLTRSDRPMRSPLLELAEVVSRHLRGDEVGLGGGEKRATGRIFGG
jgi:hypothetical protein